MRLSPFIAMWVSACGGMFDSPPADGGATVDAFSETSLGPADAATPVDASGCQPFPADAAPNLMTDAGVVTVIACPPNNSFSSWPLVADDTNLYWLDNPYAPHATGAVHACALDGCGLQPTLLADNQLNPTSLAVDETSVYWTSVGDYSQAIPGTVAKCATSGCGGSPSIIYTSDIQRPKSIAAGAGAVFWTTSLDGPEPQTGTVMRAAPDGSSAVVLATGESSPRAILIDDVNVYWVTDYDYDIRMCALTGCNGTPTTLATSLTAPVNLATDGTYIYWSTEYVQRCAISGCGNAPTILATSTGQPVGIAVTGDSVDWTETFTQRIVECSASSCNNAPIDLIGGQFNPAGVLRRGKRIYWTDYGIGYVLALKLY